MTYFVSVESASGIKELRSQVSKSMISPNSPKLFPIPVYTLSFNNKSSIFFGSNSPLSPLSSASRPLVVSRERRGKTHFVFSPPPNTLSRSHQPPPCTHRPNSSKRFHSQVSIQTPISLRSLLLDSQTLLHRNPISPTHPS